MRKFRADPLIFYTAVGFIVAFVALTIGFGERARETYSTVSTFMMDNFAWLYIGGVSSVFIFLIVLFVSRFGNYRLGDDDDEPE